MGLLRKLFGSSKSERSPKSLAQSRPPVPSNAGDQSVFCDWCNSPASFVTGTYFTANEFLTLLQKRLKPHQSVFIVTQVSGISEEALVAALPGQVSLTFTTGWLLCPSCAPQATAILPKPAGNLSGGEPGTMTRERTARDAGTGKMLTLARVMATKAMTGARPFER
jgi:hypothetical protein